MFIVDDHPIVQHGVAKILEGAPEFSLVGAAATLQEAVAVARHTRPTVILLDVRLHGTDVLTAVTSIRLATPTSQILLFTAHPGHPDITKARRAGAIATLPKELPPARLREAMRAAGDGSLQVDEPTQDRLTPRQREILNRVATGMTNAEIADELGLQTSTVKAYWQDAMQRLDVRNRAEAIVAAYRLNLL
ncbi:response regulator transcription factor [Williamsia sp. 1138]|uniref:response regulator n=1 Tax=Williamsia sp. 1138 TaxID=1903117 RepID=UPI00143DA426|nr:response regulator transcription factor [Williamsia sp. 1138]